MPNGEESKHVNTGGCLCQVCSYLCGEEGGVILPVHRGIVSRRVKTSNFIGYFLKYSDKEVIQLDITIYRKSEEAALNPGAIE